VKIDKKEFELRNHPVIISPYDDIVDKAYHEIQPRPQVDVIKLESTCPGDRIAWVSNQDLLTGQPGKQRVIHLCLKKIKDKFQKDFGTSFSVTDPQQRQKFKELIKDQLKYIVIPHEMKHIDQELTHGGQFPTSAEPEAEKAEKRRELQMKYLHKKASVINVVTTYLKAVQAGMTYEVPEEEKSKEDLAKQTNTVEKMIKNVITSKLPEYKDKIFNVGGFVRDRLLGKNPKDLDMVVNDPEQKMKSAEVFANKLVDALGIRSENNPHPLKEAYGIWGVALLNPKIEGKRKPFIYDGVDLSGYVIEITPPRKEGPYNMKKREPSYVEYTTIEDDARRRDLTVNALYQNMVTGEIKDYVGGLEDLKKKKLKPPDHPEGMRKIYEDDPLRFLRIVRFSGKLPGFEIDEDTKKEIKNFISDPKSKDLIEDKLSKERISGEFEKILTASDAGKVVDGLNTMKDLGMIKYISPDLEKLFDVYHDTVHHKGESIWEHTMDVLRKTPPTLKARLAALFHDIGKVPTKTEKVDKEGRNRVQFIGHEQQSAAMVEKILKDLRFKPGIISSVKDIVHSHMGFKDFDNAKKDTQNRTMRVFIEKLYDDLSDAIAIMKADSKEANIPKVEKLEADIKSMIEEDKKKGILVEKEVKGKDGKTVKRHEYVVPLTGDDIIGIYKLQGVAIGAVLSYLKKLLFTGVIKSPDAEERKEEAKVLVNKLMKDKGAFDSLVKKYTEGSKNTDFYNVRKASVSHVLLSYVKYASLVINWVKPDFESETEEYFFNHVTKKFLKDKNIEFETKKDLIDFLELGKLVNISKDDMKNFYNVTYKKEDFEKELKELPGYRTNYHSMKKELLNKKSLTLPAPIILHINKDNSYCGFSGNRRTNLAFNYNIPLKVWMVDL
jgi:tRNA nucleotidyltransferase (CCA-adding enzyme)